MKAMQIVSFDGPASGLRYQEAPTPEPGPGEIAVDVDHAGVGYVEALFTEGLVPIDLPWTPGLEVSGRVRALGDGMDGYRVGDAVVALTALVWVVGATAVSWVREGERWGRNTLVTLLIYLSFAVVMVPLVSLVWMVLSGGSARFGYDFLTTPKLEFASLKSTGGTVGELLDNAMDPTISDEDLKVIRSMWPGKIVIKGVQTVEDSKRLIALGVDGVLLSNHGGRQLDRAPVPFRLFPAGVGVPVAVGEAQAAGLPVECERVEESTHARPRHPAQGAPAPALYGVDAPGDPH